jgi:hypothetical protein
MFFFFCGFLSFSHAKKLFSCVTSLQDTMQSLGTPEKTLDAEIEEMIAPLKKKLRTVTVKTPEAEHAIETLQKAFDENYEYPSSEFAALGPYLWSEHLSNIELLQKFFHGRIEYVSLDHRSFKTAYRLQEGTLDPIFFENISARVFEDLTSRMEHALEAYRVVRKHKEILQPAEAPSKGALTELLARAYIDVRNRMPTLAAMSVEFYRLSLYAQKHDGTFDLPSRESLQREDFLHFLIRSNEYNRVAHEYLRLRQVLAAYAENPAIQAQILRLDRY